jgi:hypothetical protein|uniref:Uncharacterized protein n=1 Tax=Myoviridae sp. ctcPl3 TaxID=2826669 RepID=A0A8S5QVZ7_9CAUD|nr:MAG TPA: hypothetical protein [Myoviridae sp. ctcPl3]
MSVLSWGKPRIFIKDLDTENAKWKEVPTPVENSTQLTPTKGDKKEAKLEGGENEDVKYAKNTYALAYQIRKAKGKVMPFDDDDGVISGNYTVALQPEDPTVPGFIIDKSVVSAEDNFTAEEGGSVTYTHDALKPETGKQVKWGVITVTEADGEISNVAVAAS